ncbi:hypothetical protein C8K30_10251 [Promicromonospora sp. AC04]|uniref:hypothetical protein n=1 Tax=Promicromonospora sp. AC04 TaxID=2135723 RepID=UPI000D376B5E|nr:hypothetical protein [Promicromonospora sp. AC04]PUB29676.1 hypothetical protein C8K30_10251 [Promicromonospora sp. AC04]
MALGTYYFVVEGTGDDKYLTQVKGPGTFAETGTRVLRVVLSQGVTHLINSGGTGFEEVQYGVLLIRSSAEGPVLRTYGDWLLSERVPFDGR